MTGSSIAGIITASASVITALALLFAALPALIKVLRQLRAVHTIVNQQHTDMVRYQNALVATLLAAGIDIPVDQANPDAAVPLAPVAPRLRWWQRR